MSYPEFVLLLAADEVSYNYTKIYPPAETKRLIAYIDSLAYTLPDFLNASPAARSLFFGLRCVDLIKNVYRASCKLLLSQYFNRDTNRDRVSQFYAAINPPMPPK